MAGEDISGDPKKKKLGEIRIEEKIDVEADVKVTENGETGETQDQSEKGEQPSKQSEGKGQEADQTENEKDDSEDEESDQPEADDSEPQEDPDETQESPDEDSDADETTDQGGDETDDENAQGEESSDPESEDPAQASESETPEGQAGEGSAAEGAGAAEEGAAAAEGAAAGAESAAAAAETTAVAAEGVAVGASALAAAAPWIALVLGIILVLVLVFGTSILSVVAICESDWISAEGAVYVGLQVSTLGQFETQVCKKLEGFGPIVQQLEGGISIPPGTEFCPNVTPPPRVRVECEDCVDLRTLGIPLKNVSSSESSANRDVANKLKLMLDDPALNNKYFRVTEAFCPTVRHEDSKHYNGKAVDINDKRGSAAATPDVVAEIYRDAQRAGFSHVLCEYSSDFLQDERDIRGNPIICSATEFTTGGTIHVEVP